MSNNLIRIGQKKAYRSVSGRILKYTVEMYHEGLNEHKVISAPEESMLNNKIILQQREWMEKWRIISSRQSNLEEANRRTEGAVKALKNIEDILIHSLSVNNAINWENLKKKENYPEQRPLKPLPKTKKIYLYKPQKEEPKFSFVENMFKSKKELKIKEYEDKYSNLISNWEKEKVAIDQYNARLDLDYNIELKRLENDVSKWEERRKAFLKQQENFNANIEQEKEKYLSKNEDSILEYCEMVLNYSKYPSSFPNNFQLEYHPENKILIIEFELPIQEDLPTIKEVKYVASTKQLKEISISESQISKMYDDAIYKITLRTMHEIFESDVINVIDAISFNGWVKSINKATGKEETNCILSIQAKKSEFIGIDLAKVDPKTCFRTLKGVASSKLSSLTPIQPILQINRNDKRFVEPYEVVNQIDNSTNLAAMDWEDFENLIRELFEKEFKANGGEVKITQASRDGGVDAVAFDPDPIRGGKIVIQAKRYTNVVGVSAVRDLFGTVMNEGATKGILVTTAYYGADAYNFAKGKPLTLLNGSNLLSLLEKHGLHAKIDLKEAKKLLNEE